MSSRILILYYSRTGATQQLADAIAQGVEKAGAEAVLRTVEAPGEPKSSRDLTVDVDDLSTCDGLILGSPTRFGHMAAALQQFWERTSTEWLRGVLVDKPAAVFTSSSSMHGGQESTLLSLAVPLLHHGMILCGIPYTEPGLQQTSGGGSPYGASHVEHADKEGAGISTVERDLAVALGTRVARIALQLQSRS
ncbi:transcriptional regulator [Pseudidiomarina aestuarii]|uniref:Transcriptional regulator n=1 Tax=Pseudidiomarina aestuarii TaxID=624146 RepID=A0A6N4DIJ9_9GAMM|nr:transcriptional regulator [Pseudidiomarina aestuarii]